MFLQYSLETHPFLKMVVWNEEELGVVAGSNRKRPAGPCRTQGVGGRTMSEVRVEIFAAGDGINYPRKVS